MKQKTQDMALLVMDMQTTILERLANASAFVKSVAKAIEKARDLNIPVMYVTVGFRPGAPEISSNNKTFAAAKERWAANASEMMKIHPDIAPRPEDIIVTKRRISAFTGSDLEVILRALHVRHLVLTGISTSGVVLSTVREAADKDYRLTILSDGCADGDEEVHRVLTTKIFPRQAEIETIEEWSK